MRDMSTARTPDGSLAQQSRAWNSYSRLQVWDLRHSRYTKRLRRSSKPARNPAQKAVSEAHFGRSTHR